LFYLRTFRMTAIITLSIPLCVMITITALYFMDWSLNIVTMTGLMVGVGMVVDNAIVILENIFRMRSRGDDPRQASIGGASEVALAITMATLTTVVVFLPLIFMGGDAWLTFQLSRVGVPVIIALLGSLFMALIFIPVAAHRLGGRRARREPKSIGAMRKVYGRSLAWTMSHRRDALLIIAALFATILYPYERTKMTDRVRGNINDLRIRLHAPANFTSEDISQILTELESYLQSRKGVYGIRTARASYRKTFGQIQVFLHSDPTEAWWHVAYRDIRAKLGFPLDDRMDRAGVIDDLRENLPKFVGVRMSVQGRGGGRRDPSLSVYLYGNDTEVLAGMLAEAERRLRTIPSVTGVDSDLERADDEVRIRIDRDQARTHGIPARVVGRSIAYSLQGIGLPRYQADHREVRTRLYLDRSDRQTLHQLKNFTFRSRSGEEVPLASFAAFEIARGSGTIRRQNGKTRLRIQVFANRKDLRALYTEIDRAMENFQMPRGYSWDKGERYYRFRRSRTEYTYAIAMAVTCVFLLMGVLFESFILPFSVLFSIPFAFLGVYWTLYLTDTPLDIMA
ncbi:MAG: efflux RND transporter permease subunit, partial [Candidatus Latescibacteria bacterium]|nr:efflux RND transporter permease subunit [Candidatus Latescibacterota bacterium]